MSPRNPINTPVFAGFAAYLRADQDGPRALLTNSGLLVCFVFALNFLGPGLNPMFLIPAFLGPALTLITAPRAQLLGLIASNAKLLLCCVVMLAVIILHHLTFSTAPDTSYIPSVVLALLPLWVLALAAISAPLQLWRLCVVLVLLLAAASSVEYILIQQRAYSPLIDPGNYLTLLYLFWLPWMCRTADARLSGPAAWVALGTFVFVLAQLATESRFAALSVGGGLVLLVLLASQERQRWPVAGWHIAGATVGVIVYWLVANTQAQGTMIGAELAQGMAESESVRMHLWHATIDAIGELGGLNGTGLYTFALIFPMFRSVEQQGTAGLFTHNDFLQLALEGGIWLSLPLMAFTLLVAVGFVRSLFLKRAGGILWRTERVGILAGIGLMLVHSLLNFVFYLAPLMAAAGIMLALAFASRTTAGSVHADSTSTRRIPVVLRIGVLVLALANLTYLSLDVLGLGVFSGHKRVPGAAYIRADLGRALEFAQLAQRINGNRAWPVQAEAQILGVRMAQAPTPLLFHQADSTYLAALQADRWNPSTYLAYERFLARYASADSEQTRLELLQHAMQLNPYDVAVNRALLEWHMSRDQYQQSLDLVRNTLKWCKAMAPQSGTPMLMDKVEVWIQAHGDDGLAEELRRCRRSASSDSLSRRNKTTIMRWLDSAPS